MKVAIHQSQYLPWPPYFKKLAAADLFVSMDSVQFQKNGVQNRNQIRNKEQAFWLTIPVTGRLEDTIRQKRLADDRWREKHRRSIEGAYSKAPFWSSYGPELAGAFARPYETLGDANDAFFELLLRLLKIGTKTLRLSELQVQGTKSELVLAICKAVGADTYVSGPGAKAYLDETAFEREGIRIQYMDSTPPVYLQFHGGEFIPGLSMLDMMFNVDPAGLSGYLAS